MSFLGLLNYQGCYIFNVKSLLIPQLYILHKDKLFKWTTFENSKEELEVSKVFICFN